MSTVIESTSIQTVRDQLLKHPIYEAMTSPDRVRIFMKHHVFAVWDFMSLAKRLQNSLTTTTLPWVPSPNAHYARFINEIVLGEETDEDGQGGYASHFELYVEAMKEVQADTTWMESYLQDLEAGKDPIEVLQNSSLPPTIVQFVTYSLNLAFSAESHEVTSAFFFGREDLIPEMFTQLLSELDNHDQSTERIRYYLNRHIELDGDTHGPLAEKLLNSLCESDPEKWKQAEEVALRSLQLRSQLWDGVLAEIGEKGL
ncbi:DUF3050 domain-containing protein [Baia soyae]|uniref:DUF3050 family protein n=1 Tax=Baia soyae TaxID=1544746 RepID=A0A4R2RPW8_9BACL|nr:DUF3050 domain-containing protein [Baia soyae]TCP64427.1 DUF3050 family protein [Baia soyae]